MLYADTHITLQRYIHTHIDTLIAAVNYRQKSLKGTSLAFFKEIIKTSWKIVGETFKVLPDGPSLLKKESLVLLGQMKSTSFR